MGVMKRDVRSRETHAFLSGISPRLHRLALLLLPQTLCDSLITLTLSLLPERRESLIKRRVQYFLRKVLVQYMLVMPPVCFYIRDDAILHTSVVRRLFGCFIPDEADGFGVAKMQTFKMGRWKFRVGRDFHAAVNVLSHGGLNSQYVMSSVIL